MFQRILVATDGSEVSDRAARHAIELAARLGASLLAVHVAPAAPAYAYFAQGIEGADLSPEAALRNGTRFVGAVRDWAAAENVPCEVMTVIDNRPWCEIVAIARNSACDLIIMGSHGRRGMDRLLLGSETHKVLLNTSLPVLIYQ